ncbi:2-isopropylmalate synthase [Oscillatoriales cyanobacterium LEGE 11467]|uniref:2-isopropylmalate synthase n=2 Tax=Zarconia TaxID=2992130 RepID=A0A928W2Q5_9CYAN|nr:2-isopropylmalate synthase [Zarconia navalis LEGE 11467]
MLEDKNRISILDTTLRDGELAPGVQMTLVQKIKLAQFLEAAGVDIIEVGYPGQFDRDLEAIRQVSWHLKQAVVCGLAGAKEAEIIKVVKALEPAKNARIHLYTNVRLTPKQNRAQVLETIATSIAIARQYCNDIQWSAFDATRSQRSFLHRAIETAIAGGATTINIPDSLGLATPAEFSHLIRTITTEVKNIDRAVLSVHCHDDRGMAVENSIAGIDVGVRQIECSVRGLGARKGNADLERVAIAILNRWGDRIAVNPAAIETAANFVDGILFKTRQST